MLKKFKYYLRKLRKRLKIKSKRKPKRAITSKQVSAAVEHQSTKIVNLVGYIILLLTLLDYAALFITAPQLFNPVWGWETAGKLVETVWGSLLGFLLIFYRRRYDFIKPKELTILSLLSWLALIIGTLYFLITPILIGNALRINRTQKAQVTAQISQQEQRVREYSQQLDRASDKQLDNLLQAYQQQAPLLEISSSRQLKENLLTQVNQQQQQTQKQLQTNFTKQKFELFKTTCKWLIGAIISGISFILIWRFTRWARVLRFSNKCVTKEKLKTPKNA